MMERLFSVRLDLGGKIEPRQGFISQDYKLEGRRVYNSLFNKY